MTADTMSDDSLSLSGFTASAGQLFFLKIFFKTSGTSPKWFQKVFFIIEGRKIEEDIAVIKSLLLGQRRFAPVLIDRDNNFLQQNGIKPHQENSVETSLPS